MTYALHVETSVRRPGRRFEPIQERALHADALRVCEGLPGASRGLVVVPEFVGPIGIPDFTAYVGPTSNLLDRQRIGVAPVVSDLDAGILSVAHVARPRSVDELASSLGWPAVRVTGRIRRLVAIGALIEARTGAYVRPTQIDASGRLYAIEAKVDDWRRALRQVRTYRIWADAYVIVMTGLSSRTKEALLAEVRRDRGGLVVDGEWLARPRIEVTDGWRRLQALELFAASTEGGLVSPTITSGPEA